MTRTLPLDGSDQFIALPAASAADPFDTPATSSLEESKLRSKLTIETSAPPSDARFTEMPIPVSPGSPDPLLTERSASGDCAEAPLVNPRSRRRIRIAVIRCLVIGAAS